MASEISWRDAATGSTVYATIRSAARTMWNGSSLEALTVANWGNYDVAMVETPASSYFYVGSWPAALTTVGWYWIDIYSQAGASPAISDTMLGTIVGYWDGTGFLPWAGDARAISGDPTAADNWEAILDGTGAVLTLTQLRINSSSADSAIDVDNSVGPALSLTGTENGVYISSSSGKAVDIYSSDDVGPAVQIWALNGPAVICMSDDDYAISYVGLTGDIKGTGTSSAVRENIQGNLSGSVGSVTGAVGSVTGAVGSVTGAVGSVTAMVSANAIQISGDATAANKLEALLDGTGVSQDINLTMKSITIVNAAGDAISVAGNANAMSITGDVLMNITGNLIGSVGSVTGAVGSVTSKTGFKLASDGLDSIAAAEPEGKPTTFPGWIMWLIQAYRRAKLVKTGTGAATLTVEKEDGTAITTQSLTDDGTTEQRGAPS